MLKAGKAANVYFKKNCTVYIAANAEMSLAQGALAPPEFGSSVTLIPTRESRLCPMHTTLLLAPLDWKS